MFIAVNFLYTFQLVCLKMTPNRASRINQWKLSAKTMGLAWPGINDFWRALFVIMARQP